MKHTLGLSTFLAAVWLLLSGHYTPLILCFGAGSVALVVWLSLRMDLVDHEGHPLHLTYKIPLYWVWLGWEIAKSNWKVMHIILSPRLNISPTMVKVAAHEQTELGQVIFANSITLSPGTISVGIEDGVITVHALTREGAEDIEGGEMDRRVCALEPGSKPANGAQA